MAGSVLFLELYKRDGFFSDLEMMLCAGYLREQGLEVRRLKWWLERISRIADCPHPFADEPKDIAPAHEVEELRQAILSRPRPDLILINRYMVTNLGSWLAREFPDTPVCLVEHNRDHTYPDIPHLLEQQHPPTIQRLVHRLRTGEEAPAASIKAFDGYWEAYHPLVEYEQVGQGDALQQGRVMMLTEGGCPFRADVRKNKVFDDLEFDNTEEELRGCSFCYEAGDPRHIQRETLLRVVRAQLETMQDRQPPPGEYSFDGLRILHFMPELAEMIEDIQPLGKRFMFAPRVDTINLNAKGIRTALERLRDTDYRLVFHLIGFENFSQKELDIYNKGVEVQENIDCIHLLREWEREFPGHFETTGYSSHGFLMFNPWTTIEDLQANIRVIIDEGFEDFRERPWLTKLRLVPALPLHAMAKRDDLILSGYDDEVMDTSRATGYMQETPWRFQDARVKAVWRWTNRLLAYRTAPHDQLLLKKMELPQREVFRILTEIFADGSLLSVADEVIPTVLLHYAKTGQLPTSLPKSVRSELSQGRVIFLEITAGEGTVLDQEAMLTAGYLRAQGLEVRRLKWHLERPALLSPRNGDETPAADGAALKEALSSQALPDLVVIKGNGVGDIGAWLCETFPGLPTAQMATDARLPDVPYVLPKGPPTVIQSLLFSLRHGGIEASPEALPEYPGIAAAYSPMLNCETIGEGLPPGLDQANLIVVDEDPVAFIARQLQALVQRRPQPTTFLLDRPEATAHLSAIATAFIAHAPAESSLCIAPRPEDITECHGEIEACLSLFASEGHTLKLYGVDLGNFSAAEREALTPPKPDPGPALDALERWEALFPAALDCRSRRGYTLQLATPRTTLGDLAVNCREALARGLEDRVRRPWIPRSGEETVTPSDPKAALVLRWARSLMGGGHAEGARLVRAAGGEWPLFAALIESLQTDMAARLPDAAVTNLVLHRLAKRRANAGALSAR